MTVIDNLKSLGPTLYAALGGTFYVLGFLVLNANLAYNGIVDYEFVDARYIISGSVFAFFLTCFYLFAGRTVVYAPRWIGEELQRYQRLGVSPKWNVVVFVRSIVNAAFACCLSAGLFNLTAFGDRETAIFFAILSGAFVVLYWFDTTDRDLKHPRTYLVVSLAIRLGAVVAFFANPDSGMLGTTFGLMLILFFFINFVLDTIARHGVTNDRLSFSGVYALVMLLTTAIAFGATLYGQVSTKIGGARPQTVSIALTREAVEALPANLASGTPLLVSGKLIHQTEKHLYLLATEKTLRIRNADVIAIVATPERQKSFWSEFIESKARGAGQASSPNPSVEARPNGIQQLAPSPPQLER